MKKRFILSVIILLILNAAKAQQVNIDSLKNEFLSSKNDTIQLILAGKLANTYSEINPDSAYYYAGKMLAISKDHHFRIEEVAALNEMGYALLNMGNYPRSLQTLLSAISIAKDPASEKKYIAKSFPAFG